MAFLAAAPFFAALFPALLAVEPSGFDAYSSHPLIVWAVTAIISLIVSVAVTWGGQRERIRLLTTQTTDLALALKAMEKDLTQARIDRAECAAECARTFAPLSSMARLISDQTTQTNRIFDRLEEFDRGIDDKLSKIHGRINDVSNEVAALTALQGSGKPK